MSQETHEVAVVLVIKETHGSPRLPCPRGFVAMIGKRSLGGIEFDNRWNDGRRWILDDDRGSMQRFSSRNEAVKAFFDGLDLEVPSCGLFDVGEEVHDAQASGESSLD